MTTPPKAGVLGWPVAHSRSPLIHGHWLDINGLAGSYEKLPVEPMALAAFLGDMRSHGFVGANVTIPHKEAAVACCDSLSDASRRLGVVNTVWFEGERLCGDTTDGLGFLGALDQDAPGWDVRRRRAVVLGAGGAARSIVDALMSRGFSEIVVANRTLSRADMLARELGCRAISLEDVGEALPDADLLVNTTAAGMSGGADLALDPSRLPDHAVVDDIVYVPRITPLLARAMARGLRTVGGLGMLLHQAVPGFERWFGVTPTVTAELRALLEAEIAASDTR